MTRLLDRILARDAGYWEGMASGGAVLTTTYGSPDREAIQPQLASANRDAYGSSTVVFAAILARISLFSEARFQFQRASDKDLFGDQRLAKIQRPWPDGTEGELLARAEQDVSLAGNFYLWDAGDRLVRWRPDWVTIISHITPAPAGGWYREVLGYHYEPPREAQATFGEPQDAPASEVVHWAPIPDPQASFRGMSWLTPALREVQADSAMTAYKGKYLTHAATPNLLVKYAQKLQPGTIDSLRERITARYGGADNAFKTLVLDQGADASVIGNSLSQMDFSGVQQSGADRVLADGNVPGVIVGLEPLRGAGRGYQESMRKFADLFGRPQWRSFCGALQKLTPGRDVDSGAVRLWYDTADIAALQEGEQEKAQMSLIHAQALLTLAQAGYTQESAIKAVQASDLSQLQGGAQPVQLSGRQPQHLLPQPPGPGPGTPALPEGSTPRLDAPSVSPGDGGNLTRPSRRPASVRRADGSDDEPGDRDGFGGEDEDDGLDLDDLLADAETPLETAVTRFNPFHAPAGPGGGEFTNSSSASGGGAAHANGKAGSATATAAAKTENAAEKHQLRQRAAADRQKARHLEAELKSLLTQMRASVAAHKKSAASAKHAAATASHAAAAAKTAAHKAQAAAHHKTAAHHHKSAVHHRRTARHHHRHARHLHARISALRSRIRSLLAQAKQLDLRAAAL